MEFIETVLVKNGKIQNLEYHLKRMKKTLKHFFKNEKLKVKTEKLNFDNTDNARVRITYSYDGIRNIEVFPLKERKFKKFKIVKIGFDYSFKYKNRKKFSILHSTFSINFDEFILVKNNLITDTTISNLAFFTGKEWITPKYPLLKGTKRQELLDKRFLKEENIHVYDLPYFKKMAMINAIIGFQEISEFDIIR
ncbi:4-amino-4-deoxychorismate lyase [Lebetimonas natsushimae]|uniref:4-amino-4-deoxychorismate lyase n=1 Tax=Lebetimonas natsushimae TaxID=1936991 RepID=A0A292YCS1_9BACT|nr:aminotransferase class IV [Lebetimonas natsushimae]GAX87233.1 4-amino-4-deoxychorismate lyase [Lebetimonas natsushimae]